MEINPVYLFFFVFIWKLNSLNDCLSNCKMQSLLHKSKKSLLGSWFLSLNHQDWRNVTGYLIWLINFIVISSTIRVHTFVVLRYCSIFHLQDLLLVYVNLFWALQRMPSFMDLFMRYTNLGCVLHHVDFIKAFNILKSHFH